MNKNQPIGFFDSGVGLFSVLKETKKLLPNENYVIYADQGRNPYGEKSQHQIIKYAHEATSFLINKHHIKMMVLACNTATVLALDHLRKHFRLPFIGTVPAIKPAFDKDKKSRVAIMSTPATAKSDYLKKLINLYGDEKLTLPIGCSGLEEAIEILDYQKIDRALIKYIGEAKKFKAEKIVLGCTHYPLIKNKIKQRLDSNIKVIDSSGAIAKRIEAVLSENNQVSSKRQRDIFYTTGNEKIFSEISSKLLKYKVYATKINI